MFRGRIQTLLPIIISIALIIFFLRFATLYLLGSYVFQSVEPKQPEHRVIKLLGANIHYLEKTAAAAPIVLLHGFGGSVGSWAKVLKFMQARRVYVLDLPGFGASDRPDIAYSAKSISAYVSAFIEHQGLNNVTLVGHSMGAVVAAHTAVTMPNQIMSLVLIAPSGVPASLQFSAPLRYLLRPGLLNRWCYYLVASQSFQHRFPHSNARQALGVTASYDRQFVSLLARIEQPTLLLWSPGDLRVPIQHAQSYLAAIKHSQLYKLPEEAGHNLAFGELIAQRVEVFSAAN